MNSKHRSSCHRIDVVPQAETLIAGSIRCRGGFIRALAASLLAFVLVGCGGGSGGGGSTGAPAGPAAVDRGAAALAASSALTITITGAAVNSPPVVDFTVTNETGAGMNGIVATDLRFNIAKLTPGANGEPSAWQNYINVGVGGAVQGSQEFSAGPAFGTLVNHGDGTYTYTFATDIRSPAANPCPAPCTDAAGKALNLSFQPNATHRVTIQQDNSAYPNATGAFDFVPGGGVGISRDIVLTATCDQCHEGITAHGNRVDTRLCVTCHNPGSWVAGTPNTPVDFKVMIHRIHYRIFNSINSTNPALPNFLPTVLPSVFAGTPYKIGTADFSVVLFPQDIRNCAKCHNGTLSAQGDNWKNLPNMDACGSCHDDVYFGAVPDPAKPYQTLAHKGGIMTDNSTCVLCHAAGRFTGKQDIVVAHSFPARLKAAAAKFKYNIISVTPTTAGSTPVITFSITDPTNADAPYDIKTAPAFAATGSGASTLNLELGWTAAGSADIGNDGSGQALGQPVSIILLGNAAVAAGPAPGTFTVTSTIAIPAAQTGTLRAMIEGHPAGDVTAAGTFADALPVKSVFRDFAITGAAVARRLVVDIAKCDVCHDVLRLHDNNRNYTDEIGECAVCHNPNATDFAQRPATARPEESIDLKRMIHGIHASGFRTTALTIYRADGTAHDFSSVVFPAKLKDCSNCHTGTSYQLTGPFWDAPAAKGILGSTISTPTASAADNLRISPIAAVCSSCHDSALAKLHIQDTFPAGNFSATQAAIVATPEQCTFCHGTGRAIDVQFVHGVK